METLTSRHSPQVTPGSAAQGGASTSPAPAPPHPTKTTPRQHASHSRRAFALTCVILVVAVIASLALGAQTLSPTQVWTALTTPSGTQADVIVRDLRLPRTLLGVLVGAILGVAGVLAQSLTRNPLADPGILGVSAGAAFFIVVGTATGSIIGLPDGPLTTVALAFAGALAATALVFGATAVADRRRHTGASTATLPVIGVATSAALSAITSAVSLLNASSLDAYRFWAVGSLAGRPSDLWLALTPFALIGLALAALAGRGLDAVALGEDLAAGLGVDVRRLRALTIIAIALLTGTAVAACGPLAFVGLLVAHTGKALVGPRHIRLIPLALPLGAATVLLADITGRLVGGGAELATGVVLGLIGGPLFVTLIARRNPR